MTSLNLSLEPNFSDDDDIKTLNPGGELMILTVTMMVIVMVTLRRFLSCGWLIACRMFFLPLSFFLFQTIACAQLSSVNLLSFQVLKMGRFAFGT